MLTNVTHCIHRITCPILGMSRWMNGASISTLAPASVREKTRDELRPTQRSAPVTGPRCSAGTRRTFPCFSGRALRGALLQLEEPGGDGPVALTGLDCPAAKQDLALMVDDATNYHPGVEILHGSTGSTDVPQVVVSVGLTEGEFAPAKLAECSDRELLRPNQGFETIIIHVFARKHCGPSIRQGYESALANESVNQKREWLERKRYLPPPAAGPLVY